ncbi:peptidoglycan DD-metalloendopeptidase family protein [Fredinandcohnia humi]
MMLDFFKRIAIVAVMAVFIGLLFIGGRSASAHQLPTDSTEQWAWPVLGRVTDTFGTRQGNHKGLDIAAPYGDQIYAVEDGIVKKSEYTGSYGHAVFIEHPNGYETVYAHLSTRKVQEGEEVKKGQIIGDIGSTGNSTGPHLHFEVHNGEWNSARDNALDPFFVLTNEQILVTTHMERERVEMQRKLENLSKGYNYIEESKEELVKAVIIENKGGNVSKITIKEGETLWDLSVEYGVSIHLLMEWNKLDSTILQVGQTLYIYHDDKSTYVVKPGDSLSSIAEEVGLTINEIKSINQLVDDLIYPDQVLVIEKS